MTLSLIMYKVLSQPGKSFTLYLKCAMVDMGREGNKYLKINAALTKINTKKTIHGRTSKCLHAEIFPVYDSHHQTLG